MNDINSLYKKRFNMVSPKIVDEMIREMKISLPDEYIDFLKHSSGGYVDERYGLRYTDKYLGGIVVLGLSPSSVVDNLKFYNLMRLNDPINRADQYFSIIRLYEGEICIDLLSEAYCYFDNTYCEYHLFCSSFSELVGNIELMR